MLQMSHCADFSISVTIINIISQVIIQNYLSLMLQMSHNADISINIQTNLPVIHIIDVT